MLFLFGKTSGDDPRIEVKAAGRFGKGKQEWAG
jgi:hypothetical protein